MSYEYDNFQFDLREDGTASLVKYRGGEAIPTVPDEVGGYAVTSIGGWAFGKFIGRTPLLGVRLPVGLKTIGEYAFSNCKKISDIVVPASVVSIGAGAFSGCSSMLRAVLPPGLSEIGEWMFKDCRSLREIKLPSGVKFVGKGAFSGCRALTEVFLPDEVASVEFETFRDCRSLAVFDLPPGVTRIKDGAFKDCHSLAHLTLSDRVAFIGWQDAFPPGAIIHAAPGSYAEAYAKTKRLPFIPLETPEEDDALPRPDAIAERAFAGNAEISEALIPEGVTSIGNGAYSGFSLLSSVRLPESLLTIGIDAFAETAVSDISIPSGVVKIGWNAFPPAAVIHGEKNGPAEAFAKKNNHEFIPNGTENTAANKTMKEVLQRILEIKGAEAFSDAPLFKNLLGDLLPGGGNNAGVRNILFAAVSQLNAASAVLEDDAAAQSRFASALIGLGYQPRLAREAAVSFWSVLCYPQKN